MGAVVATAEETNPGEDVVIRDDGRMGKATDPTPLEDAVEARNRRRLVKDSRAPSSERNPRTPTSPLLPTATLSQAMVVAMVHRIFRGPDLRGFDRFKGQRKRSR